MRRVVYFAYIWLFSLLGYSLLKRSQSIKLHAIYATLNILSDKIHIEFYGVNF